MISNFSLVEYPNSSILSDPHLNGAPENLGKTEVRSLQMKISS